MDHDGGSYTLQVGPGATGRLRLLDRVYGRSTLDVLRRAGLRRGKRVAEIGCGDGRSAERVAALVGATGEVIGVDASAEQLALAELRRRAGLPLRFVRADAAATGLARESFDLVYCRFVLMHVADPAAVLREMRALLRPGGVIVCEEASLDSSFCEPAAASQRRLSELAIALGRTSGQDFCVARGLVGLVHECGFRLPEVRFSQPAFLRGPEKRLELDSFLEVAPRLLERGLCSAEELRQIERDLEEVIRDERVVYGLSRMTQVWAMR